MSAPDEPLPSHIEQSVQAIADLHDEHDKSASHVQRGAETLVRLAGRPAFAGLLLILIAAWIIGNIATGRAGGQVIDPPPFSLLQDAIGVLALFLTVLILIAQRREYRLEERRAHLTLQLALLSEQKNAKIIEMLERLLVAGAGEQVDPDASAMAKPANAATILSAVDRIQAE